MMGLTTQEGTVRDDIGDLHEIVGNCVHGFSLNGILITAIVWNDIIYCG